MLTLTSPRETGLHRWPAGVKLAALCLFTLVLFRLDGPALQGAAFALTAALAASGGARFLTAWLRLLRVLWPFLLVIALWHGITGDIAGGATILLRLLAAVGAANLVTMTTPLSAMIAVIERLARPLSPVLPPRRLALPRNEPLGAGIHVAGSMASAPPMLSVSLRTSSPMRL